MLRLSGTPCADEPVLAKLGSAAFLLPTGMLLGEALIDMAGDLSPTSALRGDDGFELDEEEDVDEGSICVCVCVCGWMID